MIMMDSLLTPVGQMFNGQSVFITGASGFVGRVLLEKLLRSYQGIKRIYILLRAKKNLSPQERLHRHILNIPIFDQIKSMPNGPQLLDKICVVEGDIGEPRLGLSDASWQKLISDSSLSIVFHSAASVKFDEPLKTSVKFNLLATRWVIELSKQLKNLICLCHVSTAYVNGNIKDNSFIEEKLYPIRQNPEDLIRLNDILDEQMMQAVKPYVIGDWPNTYTFTKALAEHLVEKEASELPVAIVRPSIIAAAWEEPLKGWVDNLNGPTGLIIAIGKGLLRTMYVSRSVVADIIPVDVCVSTMIAASYYTAKQHGRLPSTAAAPAPAAGSSSSDTSDYANFEEIEHQELSVVGKLTETTTTTTTTTTTNTTKATVKPLDKISEEQERTPTSTPPQQATSVRNKIFHCTSGDINPITWGQMEDMFFPVIRNYPSEQVLRYPFGSFKSNRYHDLVTRLFVHYLPALLIDLLCLLLGKKRQLLSIYFKLHNATDSLTHFATTNYNFKSRNIHLLRACLSEEDEKQLRLDIGKLNWYAFWDSYVLGARRFLLKEPDHTLEESRRSFRRAYYVEMGFRALLLILAGSLVAPLVARLIAASTYVRTLVRL